MSVNDDLYAPVCWRTFENPGVDISLPTADPWQHACRYAIGHAGAHYCLTCEAAWSADGFHPPIIPRKLGLQL